MSKASKDFTVRNPVGTDLAFIYASFLESYRYDSVIGRHCKNHVFFEAYSYVIDQLLIKSKVLICCHPETPECIFGYLIYDGNLIHYVFVKKIFRRLGIAELLFKTAFGDNDALQYSHKTRMCYDILDQPKFNKYKFNPFSLYKGVPEHGKTKATQG